MSGHAKPAIWFPAVRTGTGTDVFTKRLVAGLTERGIRAEITWLPMRAEYAPWAVAIPAPPEWVNVVHVSTWMHARFLPRHLPIVATLHHSTHDPALRAYKGWLRAAYHRWWISPIERRVLRRANRVVAVSKFVAEMARKTLCDVPMQVIHNGIDTSVFRPGDNRRQPGKPFRLLFVGGWKTLKGVDLLAPIMRELGGGFELRYTGGVAAEKDKPKMPANMIDIGRLSIEQVVTCMQDADAFLFPSRSEGFGLVAAEAMACGLPVIGMHGTAVDELIISGITGELVEREDVQGMVNAIALLARDSGRSQAIAERARKFVVQHFDKTVMTDAYEEVYRGLYHGE